MNGGAMRLYLLIGGQGVFPRNLDIAAIGTIADVMPLRGVNRSLVTAGIRRIRDRLTVISGIFGPEDKRLRQAVHAAAQIDDDVPVGIL